MAKFTCPMPNFIGIVVYVGYGKSIAVITKVLTELGNVQVVFEEFVKDMGDEIRSQWFVWSLRPC